MGVLSESSGEPVNDSSFSSENKARSTLTKESLVAQMVDSAVLVPQA